MNYELAKKLKDAGFPQKEPKSCPHGNPEGELDGYCGHGIEDAVYIPTLSELIEACDGKFANLKDLSKSILGGEFWFAEGGGEPKKCNACKHIDDARHTMVHGKTPEEAVANLWLALNRK